jgi:hypothetical protein
MKSSPGDYLFPMILSVSAALVAAAAGFFHGIFLTSRLSGEAGEWGLVAGPACAFLMGITAFSACFWKLRP